MRGAPALFIPLAQRQLTSTCPFPACFECDSNANRALKVKCPIERGVSYLSTVGPSKRVPRHQNIFGLSSPLGLFIP